MKRPEQFRDDHGDPGGGGEGLDPALRDLSIPTLEAGAHKGELRGLLMRELREHGQGGKGGELRESRGHSGGSSVTDPSRAAAHGPGSWRPRLGFALLAGAAAAMLLIALSAHYLQSSGGRRLASAPHSTTQGLTAAITASNAANGTQAASALPDAVQIADAIENGDFDLALAITSRYGGRVYVYRVTLAGGANAFYASDHVMPGGTQPHLHRAQELQQHIETTQGRYIPEQSPTHIGGAKLYRYRLDMSDGTRQDYLSDLEPDAGRRQRHQAELEKLISQSAGEVYGTIAGPDAASVYLVRVTLGDGTVRVYASNDKPKSR